MNNMIIIDPPIISTKDGQARVTSLITEGDSVRELWFEVEEHFKNFLPNVSLDAFVVICLLRAIKEGKDIHVRGMMSSKLHYNINGLLGGVLRDFFKSKRSVTVTADHLTTDLNSRVPGVLSGFSGGIDSFCNYHIHSGERATQFAITHFVYNNVGSHGQKGLEEDFATFQRHSASIRKFAAAEGKPLVVVNSNLDSIVGMSFEKTHTVRNASVGLLLQKMCGTFVYPSGYHVRETWAKATGDIGYLDPIILPLLGTERLDCFTTGAHFDRTQKSAIVAEVPASWKLLDICLDPFKAKKGKTNCSMCRKCVRQMITFEALGKLDRYEAVFDFNDYLACKNLFLVDVLKSDNPLQTDVAAFLKQVNYDIPWRVRAMASVLPVYVAKRLGRKVVPHIPGHPLLAKICNLLLGRGKRFTPEPGHEPDTRLPLPETPRNIAA